MKKTNLKLSAYLAFAIIVGVVAVFGSVKAYQSYSSDSPKVVVEGNYIEAATSKVNSNDGQLGALPGPDLAYNYLSVNGDVQYHIVSPLSQTTSTLVSFVNPFGATTYASVEMTRVDITTAASSTAASTVTSTISCGAATGPAASPAVKIVDSDAFIVTNTPYIANGVTSALGAAVGGGTTAKIALSPTNPYFTCVASNSSIFGTSNVAGTVTVRVSKTR